MIRHVAGLAKRLHEIRRRLAIILDDQNPHGGHGSAKQKQTAGRTWRVSDLPQARRRTGWGATDWPGARTRFPPGGVPGGYASREHRAARLTAGSRGHELFNLSAALRLRLGLLLALP